MSIGYPKLNMTTVPNSECAWCSLCFRRISSRCMNVKRISDRSLFHSSGGVLREHQCSRIFSNILFIWLPLQTSVKRKWIGQENRVVIISCGISWTLRISRRQRMNNIDLIVWLLNVRHVPRIWWVFMFFVTGTRVWYAILYSTKWLNALFART